MSYEIIYDRQFIKAEKDGKEVFFPMFYMGSSNCTQISRKGREIRERDWHNTTYPLKGKRFGTLEEMIAFVEQERCDVIARNEADRKECEAKNDMSWFTEYDDKRWGYFSSLAIGGANTRRTSFGSYKGLFITGCKKALTVEELAEIGVCVIIQTASFYYMQDELERYKKAGKEKIYHTVKTSKELLEKLEEFEAYLIDFPKVSLFVTLDADENDMKRVRREKFPTKKTKPEYKEVDKYFVVHIINYGYFYSSKKYGFRYTPYQNSGKRFASEKAASNFVKRFAERHSQYSTVIETVNEKTTVRV